MANTIPAEVTLTTLCDITEKCVAIVRFGPGGFATDGFTAGQFYQVTIDPANKSPSGEMMRFGFEGDEIVGWQRCAAIYVVEILSDDTEKPKSGVTALI